MNAAWFDFSVSFFLLHAIVPYDSNNKYPGIRPRNN